jgi:tetratricopeptide (TPR) repeat protein
MDEYNFQVKELLDKVVQKIKFEKFKSQKELFLASEDNKNSSLNRDNQNPFKTYIVKKGDTLGKIAKLEMGSFNKYKDLAKYNKLSINTILKIGQPLKIPLPGHLNTPGSVRPLNTPAPSTGPSNLKARTVQVIEVNNSGKITNQKSKKIVDYSSLTNKKSNNTDNSITSRPVQISPVTPGPEIFYKPLAPEKPVINKKREIFDIKPKSAEDYYNLAQGYWKLGKIENAMENYSKAIKLNPAYLAKGRAKLIDDAILRLEEKSSSDPAAFAKLHLKLADMLQKRGELELAAKELLRAIELDESREEAYFTLGMIYEKLGEKELAINTYEKINEMFASRDEIISLASDRIALLAGGQ